MRRESAKLSIGGSVGNPVNSGVRQTELRHWKLVKFNQNIEAIHDALHLE
jgi:hypothetical protein